MNGRGVCGHEREIPVKRPRGRCPQCGETKAVTTQGRIWAHAILVSNHFGVVSKQLCPGTGRRPLVEVAP